jgi:hypothetical protein
VTVNQHNPSNFELDGANGKFVGALGNDGGNLFQVVTPDGKVMGSFHLNGVNGEGFDEFEKALAKWKELPESQRKPKKLKLDGEAKPLPIEPPPGGLVIRVYTRNLKRDSAGRPARITKEDLKDRKEFGEDWAWGDAIYTEPMPDVLWLTEAEWKSLLPASPKEGDTYEVPAPIRMRIFRFHLINNAFGIANWWSIEQVRSGRLTLTVEEVTPLLRLRLDGAALLAKDADLDKADHGFDAKLAGSLVYDPKEGAFNRFDFVAVGDSWGGDFEGGRWARPGRTPLGVAFELTRGRSAAELIPPKGINFKEQVEREYFAADGHSDK